jgi:hypothetical protein
MGGPNSLDPISSSSRNSSSPAVLPQACSQVLEYVAGARGVYDVQLKVRKDPAYIYSMQGALVL